MESMWSKDCCAPNGTEISLVSVRILARTGKAVIDMPTPVNTAREDRGTSAYSGSWSRHTSA